nr:hypothetical protein [Tanacetum cinerariifolium]
SISLRFLLHAKVSIQPQDDDAVSKSPGPANSELDSEEDDSDDEKDDVDMEDGRHSPAAEPVAPAQTHSPKDDLLQTPPA